MAAQRPHLELYIRWMQVVLAAGRCAARWCRSPARSRVQCASAISMIRTMTMTIAITM